MERGLFFHRDIRAAFDQSAFKLRDQGVLQYFDNVAFTVILLFAHRKVQLQLLNYP